MSSINLYNNTIAAMNSRLDVVLWDKNQSIEFDSVFAKMEKLVENVEIILSRYDAEAEVYALNQSVAEETVKISNELFAYIEQSIRYHDKTNGYFNIGYEATVCSGLKLADQLILNRDHKTVKFTSEEVVLDFGGIGKGIALSKIAFFLEKEKVFNAFISFGGSSILTRGKHPYGDYWPLNLEEGRDTNLQLNDSALSISGFHNENQCGHVANPKTGKFEHKLQQVQVQLDCPIEAEVLSTALLIAPVQEHEQIIKAFNPDKCILIPL